MRVRLDGGRKFINVDEVEIISGGNYLIIGSDEYHPERNFDIQATAARCDMCEAFYDEECVCDEGA